MNNKWSVLLLLTMGTATLTQATPDAGKSADQLRDLASQSKSTGDLQGEATYLCQAATLDEKKYGKKCERAKDDLTNALARFRAYLGMGTLELQNKNYAAAVRDLGKVKFGPGKDQAQELMQQARIGLSGGTPVDPASLEAYKAARDAYAHGDFDTAQKQAQRVQSSVLQTAANQMLSNINVYLETMKQADTLAHNGDLPHAAEKYRFAVAIQANGPGNPQQRLTELEAEEAKAAAEQQQQAQSVASGQASMNTITPRVVQKPEELSKLKRLLATADRDEARVDFKGALQAYSAALALDPRQAQAVEGRKRVTREMQDQSGTLDDLLKKGIHYFYTSQFSEADTSIGLYLQESNPRYAGAAHFYLGASLLTQSLLTSLKDRPQADAIRRQAQDQFIQARQFHYEPVEAALSPKIWELWTASGGTR
jgi:hypothetical protein